MTPDTENKLIERIAWALVSSDREWAGFGKATPENVVMDTDAYRANAKVMLPFIYEAERRMFDQIVAKLEHLYDSESIDGLIAREELREALSNAND